MPNEDLSRIIVADGMFDHHMPDILQEVIEHLYQQQVEGNFKGLKVATLNDPLKLDTNYDDKEENGQSTQSFHNGVVFSALSDTKKSCMNEDTIKTVDKDWSNTDATVHSSPANVHISLGTFV